MKKPSALQANRKIAENMLVGVDGTLIRKNGKGITRVLLSFLEAFLSEPPSDIDMLVFVCRNAEMPAMPKHPQIRYAPVGVYKQIGWDLFGFDRELKKTRCDVALTLNDRVKISGKYLLYYFEIPDYRIAANKQYAGAYQKISDQLTRLFLKKTFAEAFHIAAGSCFTRGDLLSKYDIPAGKVSVVYPAPLAMFKPLIDPDKKRKIRKRYGAEGGYFLHFSSNNDARDNTSAVLKAFSISLSELKKDHKLLICGTNDLQAFGGSKLLDDLDIREKVILAGFVPDAELIEIYQAADIYVDASLYEGFGLQVLEAMACGVPVVCSASSSLPEVGGDAPAYADPNNAEKIADEIIHAIEDPLRLREMKERGLRQSRNFSKSQMLESLLNMLRMPGIGAEGANSKNSGVA